MILQSFKLDVIPDGKKKEIWLNQYDDDFVLQITLFSSAGTLSIPSGTTAAIRGTKPDGNGYSANAVLSDNVVTVTGDQQMTVVAGKAIFEITLYNDNKELNTANFILHIERAALDKDTPTSRSQTRELVEIEDNADELIAAATAAAGAADRAAASEAAAAASADLAQDLYDSMVILDGGDFTFGEG